jgi:negative regulator of sigma E activity
MPRLLQKVAWSSQSKLTILSSCSASCRASHSDSSSLRVLLGQVSATASVSLPVYCGGVTAYFNPYARQVGSGQQPSTSFIQRKDLPGLALEAHLNDYVTKVRGTESARYSLVTDAKT